MKLLNKYIQFCNNERFIKFYTSTARGMGGNTFEFINTNYRSVRSFIKNYNTFKNGVEGKKRSEWELHPGHHQERLKQHSVNMLKSRLFSKNVDTYYSTNKGKIISKIPENFSPEEEWLVVYFLIVDGYFEDVPCYILNKTKEVFEDVAVYDLIEDEFIGLLRDFIVNSKNYKIEEIFKHDFTYFDSFHIRQGSDSFFSYYIYASENEKKSLQNYVIKNYKEIKQQKKPDRIIDPLSYKYKPSGAYNITTLQDNAKLLLLSNYINTQKFKDLSDYFKRVIMFYNELVPIDTNKIIEFIAEHSEVLEITYKNIFDPDYFDNVPVEDLPSKEKTIKELTKIQEKSVIENVEDLEHVSSLLKRKALELSQYTCELEDLWGCSSHYFTSKKTGKNYLELHHLVPRQFSNDFEVSIEKIDNYISLCPRCHRFLHLAMDRERCSAIKFLYKQRKEALENVGIVTTEERLLKYYGIEQ